MRYRTKLTVAFVLIILAVSVFAASAVEPGGTFVDDDGNVHEASIEAIALAGITVGCNPPDFDEYCPNRLVTRAEMAVFLDRVLDLPAYDGPNRFVDDDGAWFEAHAERLAQSGITLGCNPPDYDEFCGEDPVRRGQIAAFFVRAYDYTVAADDPFIDDDDSIFEDFIEKLAAAGITRGCNPPDYDEFCPNAYTTRAQMATFFARAEGLPTPPVPPRLEPAVSPVATGLSFAIDVQQAPGSSDLMVAEKGGLVKVVDGGTVLPTPFLDVRSLVSSGSEQGLLAFAFHPDFTSNDLFFVSYTNTSGDLVVASYEVSSDPRVADTSTRRQVIVIDQPAGNHNGGDLEFGTDGMLLISVGDGGGSGGEHDDGQDPTTLLSSVLRIDVDGDDFASSAANYAIPPDNPFVGTSAGADEVWAYGLRNPWRIANDPVTDVLYIADVGQGAREEVNAVPYATGGLNYGWNTTEGTLCYSPSSGCSTAGITFPVTEYPHPEGCSVTGGLVYRGESLGQYAGHYIYSDYCSGVLRSFKYDAGTGATKEEVWTGLGSFGPVTSFGTADDGRFFVVTPGTVFELVGE